MRLPAAAILVTLMLRCCLAQAADGGAGTESVPGGLPEGRRFAPSTWVRRLHNRGFVVGYSELRRNPLWVAYHARPLRHRRPLPRPREFAADERSLVRVTPADFRGSGYQRGHMAPNYLISQLYGRGAQRQTFLMSNISPQRPALNQKLWQRLEEAEADHLLARQGPLWVVVGPVFDRRIEWLSSGVEVPDAFYRIYLDANEPQQPRLLAFLVPQGVQGLEPLDRFVTTVDAIEAQTGLDFFSALEDGLEAAAESAPADADWALDSFSRLPPRY